ncbi:MAG TPA: DUF4397 domain-containing protein [Povalibacter sp.]|uniref:DUF4397 domain-containing protein n=1 Tax=Povalibacter sp. TaxID=1962978 RepID=UPI002CC28388|nr:DUF4397 domain-containing protein [Povalibacter sp.]HMN46098.1 DUF4397 domain-containing protein [Povalibacter sp.]
MKVLKALAAVLPLALFLGACNLDDIKGGDDDKNKASLRLLNLSPGYQSLDLYANDGTSSDELKLEAVGYNTMSDYASFADATYSLKLRRAGVSSTLQTLSSAKLVEDSHTVLVAYGSNGHFGSVVFNEDASDAGSGESKIILVNTGEAGSLSVYLTGESVALEDATPQFSGVAHGSAASAVIVESGTYRLRVTGAGDTADVRLDLAEVAFKEKEVTALLLSATQGGVLVNAVLLPQQGSPTLLNNSKARIRGAVGIANGTSVTAKVGSVSLLSNAGIGVIGSRYSQVEAGTATVSVAVDGTALSVPAATLAAGGDYTLLVWSNTTNGAQTTLISDDNRLPVTSGKAKVRIINGVSGLEAPITLSVDYSPLIEGIALGTASSFVEVDGGLNYQFDIANGDTGVNLFTRTGTSMQTGSVYTMFMHGGGTSAVGATLRKDR